MNIIAFFLYCFATIYSPGPNIIVAMSLANRLGVEKIWRFVLGVFIAFVISLTLDAAFSRALFAAIPKVEPLMYVFGGCYLTYLAHLMWKDDGDEGTKNFAAKNTIKMGMLNQFSNIKTQIFGITVFSNFILPYYRSPFILFGFSICLSLFSVSAIYSWAYLGTVLLKFFGHYRKYINAALALSLMYCAYTMFREIL
ncbi:LysE family transporter [Eubacteriales bacterium KG127]